MIVRGASDRSSRVGLTVVGILLMALLGGLGGGITRDILIGKVPSALTNPAYITLALAFGIAPAAMLLLAACGHRSEPPPTPVAQQTVAMNAFVGSAVCGECHRKIHAGSYDGLALGDLAY